MLKDTAREATLNVFFIFLFCCSCVGSSTPIFYQRKVIQLKRNILEHNSMNIS